MAKNKLTYTNYTFNHGNTGKLIVQLDSKFHEIDTNTKIIDTSIIEANTKISELLNVISNLTDKINTQNEQYQKDIGNLQTKYNNDYDLFNTRLTTIDNSLNPIQELYLGIKNILCCNDIFCAGNSEVIYIND